MTSLFHFFLTVAGPVQYIPPVILVLYNLRRFLCRTSPLSAEKKTQPWRQEQNLLCVYPVHWKVKWRASVVSDFFSLSLFFPTSVVCLSFTVFIGFLFISTGEVSRYPFWKAAPLSTRENVFEKLLKLFFEEPVEDGPASSDVSRKAIDHRIGFS